MAFPEKLFKQRAVYWAPAGLDSNGQMTYEPPIEIKCRWSDISSLYLDTQGEQAVSQATVMVDRDVKKGGILWKGKLQTVISQSVPLENPDAAEIKRFESEPNIKATKFFRTALCDKATGGK
jgi:hypothetical protein